MMNAIRGRTSVEEVLRVTLDDRRRAPHEAAKPHVPVVAEAEEPE